MCSWEPNKFWNALALWRNKWAVVCRHVELYWFWRHSFVFTKMIYLLPVYSQNLYHIYIPYLHLMATLTKQTYRSNFGSVSIWHLCITFHRIIFANNDNLSMMFPDMSYIHICVREFESRHKSMPLLFKNQSNKFNVTDKHHMNYTMENISVKLSPNLFVSMRI